MANTKEIDCKSEGQGRRIYVTGELNEEKSEKIITSLLDLEAKNPLKDVVIYINSYGGYIDDLLAIHDTIKILRCTVATVCVGKAMSAAAMLLMSGTKGYRFITPSARVMLHQVHACTFGNVSEMENNITEFKRLQDILKEMTLKYTAIKKNEFEKIFEKDSYYSAEDAIKLGIVDEMIITNTDFYRRLKL